MFKLRYILYPLILSLIMFIAFKGIDLMKNVSNVDQEKFEMLMGSEYQKYLYDNPISASYLGDLRYNTKWNDVSLDKIKADNLHDLAIIDQLEKMDLSSFTEANILNFKLFLDQYKNQVELYEFKIYLMPFSHRGGIQLQHETAESLPLTTLNNYEDWLTRLESINTYIDQIIILARNGVDSGIVPPKILMQRVKKQLDFHNVSSPIDSPFYKVFKNLPNTLNNEEKNYITQRAQTVISEVVTPAYAKLIQFFNDEYYPNCRETIGISEIPNGAKYYETLARHFTTTDYDPDYIHNKGLSEVERIKKEMYKILDQVQWQGTFSEFLEYLRTDSKFYFETSEELFTEYLATSKRIDPLLVKLFKDLPSMPYGLKPIPMESAPDTTTAYYQRPAADGSRAGYYYVNLYMPEVRPKYEIEALSLHEAMPGHHLQIAYTMELDLPEFRKFGGYTAFVEGWGLYSESLGDELGMYKNPYSKFGQLTYEMWRAVRLVVDTGMHYKGWTRQEAIEYFLDNAAKTKQDVINEIDRYINWPGQALAYKIGELKIKDLKQKSQELLGEDFDIKEFHHQILKDGGIPLYILEENINNWINQQIQ